MLLRMFLFHLYRRGLRKALKTLVYGLFLVALIFLPYKSVFAVAPDEISDLHTWLEADAITGHSDNDSISLWPDSSGNSHGTTGGSATYKTNQINGLPTVRFNGSSDKLSATDSASLGTGDFTFFAVIKEATQSGPRTFFSLGTPGTDNAALFGLAEGNSNYSANAYGSCGCINDGAATFGTPVIFRGYYSSGTVYIKEIGQSESNGSVSYNVSTGFYVGGLSSSQFWAGDVGEIITYSRALNSGERTDVEAYLQCKWLDTGCPSPTPTPTSGPTPTPAPGDPASTQSAQLVKARLTVREYDGAHGSNPDAEYITVVLSNFSDKPIDYKSVYNSSGENICSFCTGNVNPHLEPGEIREVETDGIYNTEHNHAGLKVLVQFNGTGGQTAWAETYVNGRLSVSESSKPIVPTNCTVADIFCQAKQWVFSLFNYVFGFNSEYTTDSIEALKDSLDTHIPFAYFAAIGGLSFGTPIGSPSAIPAFSFSFTPDLINSGSTVHPPTVTLEVPAERFEGMQPFVTFLRGFLKVLIYLGLVEFLIKLSKHII